jgi:hypothetical protein
LVALLCVPGALLVAPVAANAGTVPAFDMKVAGKTVKPVSLGATTVTAFPDGSCAVGTQDAIGTYPKPTRVRAGAHGLEIRIYRPDQPLSVQISFFTHIEPHGYPQGKPHRIGFRLQPLTQTGTLTGWQAVLRPKVGEHLLLQLDVRWAGPACCAGTDFASRGFHLAAR